MRNFNTVAAAAANVTHGLSRSRVFKIWAGMKARCYSKRSISYPNYGGRGIVVCERWMKFENFFSDMGHPPHGMQLDRINNDGNYEPSNCRWATVRENSVNRRSSQLITFNGKTLCATDWAALIGISRQGLMRRLNVLKWPIEKALTVGRTR